jgi:hypothetical protein
VIGRTAEFEDEMNTAFRCLLASTLLVSAVCAAVDPPPAATPDSTLSEILVIAPRPALPNEIAGNSIPTFVRSHINPSKRTGQLGRWRDPICLHTQGLEQRFTDFILARVQAIAATQNLAAAKTCVPNVSIIFTNEPQLFMDMVAKRKPQLLGFHQPAEVPKLKTVDRPVQAWYMTETANGNLGVVDDSWNAVPPGALGSRLNTGLTSHIFRVLIVIDTKKTSDYTVGSLSDYIAMLTLSRIRLRDGCGELTSILDLMAKDCMREKPQAITAGDMAYLNALYLINLEEPFPLQRASLASMMSRELKRGMSQE